MDITVVLKDTAMRDAFVGGLKKAGYTENKNFTCDANGVGVKVRFGEPFSRV